jgi:hypothetical protein
MLAILWRPLRGLDRNGGDTLNFRTITNVYTLLTGFTLAGKPPIGNTPTLKSGILAMP